MGHSQTITIEVEETSLAVILEDLSKRYGLQYSAKERILVNCIITKRNSYPSFQKAIEALTQSCDLDYRSINDVFVIRKRQEKPAMVAMVQQPRKRTNFQYKGQVLDIKSREPLPFSSVKIQNTHLITDANGLFSYRCKDSIVAIEICHLGYHGYQGQLSSQKTHNIHLEPSITQIKEVLVRASTPVKMINLGEQAGLMKLNHQIASFLPGTGNNSIFSLLRLQPGVLAAGEQTKDYILWGSYKGQSHILFDGITIFNTSSFIEQIDVINPLIIKDIEIFKGGYNAHIGDRVGGVVRITSKSGLVDSFYNALNLNNQALSYYSNIPLVKHSNLQVGFRTSFPNVLDPETYKKKDGQRFDFTDLNLKYTIPFKNRDRFNFSFIGNYDRLDNEIKEKGKRKSFRDEKEIKKYQLGAALSYDKQWEKAGSTELKVAYSILSTSLRNDFSYEDDRKPDNEVSRYQFTNNNMSELSARIDHFLPTTKHHHLSFGLGMVYNASSWFQDTSNVTLKCISNTAIRMNSYIKNRINIGKFFSIEPGLRVDVRLKNQPQVYWQPRINAIIKPARHWKINLAYGIYHQFINENALIDDLGNYLYYWDVDEDLSAQKSMHYIGGFSCDYSFLTCNIEGYYKSIQNLRQFFGDNTTNNVTYSEGIGRSYGVDCYLKTKIKKQVLWCSYSYSKTEEWFSHMHTFQRAPHDQRHELKVAGIFNVKRFFFSMDYVWGSGFASPLNLRSEENVQPYSRLDVAFLYKTAIKKLKIETGFSILNVLNTANIRYNNFANFPDNSTKYILATPFYPTIFVNLRF